MTRAALYIPGGALVLMAALSFMAPGLEGFLGVSGLEASLAGRLAAPDTLHWLGTDELGRDLFARLLRGGRVSLTVALAAAVMSAVIGTAVGTFAGYAGGWRDAALMRLTDFLIALPGLPLLIVLAALDVEKLGLGGLLSGPEASLYKIVALISLFGWTTVARLARARALVLKSSDFVLAARALGVSRARIILRHVLPNLLNTVAVAAALSVGNIILLESSLSFLGLGIQPPVASWGNMLTNAGDNVWDHPALAFWPGAMIFVTVLAFNFLGDALQGMLDPRGKSRVNTQP